MEADSGPCLDIYALTRARTREVIGRFPDAYVDVAASEDRGDEELMMMPLGYDGPLNQPHEWEWQPAGTLSSIISLLLAEPRRGFVVYLTPKDPSLCRSMLAGTRDGALVFGVSLPAPWPEPSPEIATRAQSLSSELTRIVDAQTVVIAVEEPPPLDSTAFAEWIPRSMIVP
jgi:hypothetical protein